MKAKKIILAAATTFGLLALVGCTNGNSNSGASGGTTTIKLFNDKPEIASQMNALVKTYESTHKNVKIDVTSIGGTQNATAALQAQFTSGDAPTIFMLAGLADVTHYQSKLLDQTNSSLIKQADTGTLSGATVGGKVYGAPLDIEGGGWIINKAIFEKAGINPDTIKSFSDFQSAVETLDSKKAELGIQAVFGYDGSETWVTQQQSSIFVSQEYDNNLNKMFASRDFKFTDNADFKKYIDLAAKYNAAPLQSLDYTTAVNDLFSLGKVAILAQGSWIVPTVQGINPSLVNNMDILPSFSSGSNSGKIFASPAWYWAINKTQSSSQISAAENFLDWMYTSKQGMDAIVNKFDFIPPYKNFTTTPNDPVSKKVLSFVKAGNAVPLVYNEYPNGWGMNVLGAQVQGYAAGSISWDQLVQNVTKGWNQTPAAN